MNTKPTKRIRCAVYSRVSTDYGLDQEFNSLDAEHEAAEAYVRSAGAGRETVSSGVPGPKRTAGFGAANLWKTALLRAASSLFVSGRWVAHSKQKCDRHGSRIRCRWRARPGKWSD
jgi:hypothetical protein